MAKKSILADAPELIESPSSADVNSEAPASEPAAPAAATIVQPPAGAADPDPNELVSVFNKNPPGGDYVHHTYEDLKTADGVVIKKKEKLEWRVGGRSFAHVPRWIAALWMKQAPGIIIDGAKAAAGAPQKPLDAARVSALETENTDLKTRLGNMEFMIAELKAAQKKD